MTIRVSGHLLEVGSYPLLFAPYTRPLRIPTSTVLKGVNTTSYNTSVRDQWGADWSWPLMQRQIDNALAVGANAMRITGAVYGVQAGDFALADFLSRYGQALDYCTANGLFIYPCPGGVPSSFLGNDSLIDAFNANLAPWVQLCADYPLVVGFDGLNEPFSQFSAATPQDQIVGMCEQIAAAYHDNSPLAYTFDCGVFQQWEWLGDRQILADPIVHHTDMHVYTSPDVPAAADPAPLLASKWGRKPTIIGEFGVNGTYNSADRTAYYAGVLDVVANNLDRVAGAFAWAAIDTDDSAANQWGLFAGTDNAERTDITSVFRDFPVSR